MTDTFQDILDRLEFNDGAMLYWQMPDRNRAARALRFGAIKEIGELLVHPDAIEIEAGMAYTMPSTMQILYLADECDPSRMTLRELLGNFRDSNAEVYERDIQETLTSCGWYHGVHDNGNFCILNLEKLNLK